MLLHYFSNLENLFATEMTLLLYFFTMLPLCDIGSADVLVIYKAYYFLHGFEPSDLTGFYGHERSKEFIISSTILSTLY